MPIFVRDPWRRQYFDHVACPDDVIIPIDDMDAWALYPTERQVYDRLFVAQAQGLPAGPHGTTPPQFPVFSKPIINLKGMGIGSRVIANREEYEHSYQAGHFWMPVLEGAHVSTDCVVIDGKIRWSRHATGKPFRDGMFCFWTIHANFDASLQGVLNDFVRRYLQTYRGLVNFETIGGRIIEVHLRFADQWCDLYGQNWINSVVGVYQKGLWNFSEEVKTDSYSIPLFADERFSYDAPSATLQAEVRMQEGISSLQITFDPEKPTLDHARPPGGFRLALINAWSFDAGLAAIEKIAQAYPRDRLIMPVSDLLKFGS